MIEVQKYNLFVFNQVDDHPISDVGAHHACQIVTERLADEGIVAYLFELFVDTIPQNMVLFGKPLKVLLELGSKAQDIRHRLSELL